MEEKGERGGREAMAINKEKKKWVRGGNGGGRERTEGKGREKGEGRMRGWKGDGDKEGEDCRAEGEDP